jgi:hypothetical protein
VAKEPDPELIVQCSWCRAVKEKGKWIPFPDVIEGASHGMCEVCEAKFLKDYFEKKEKENPMAKRSDPLLGAVVADVRPATAAEKREMMWPDFMVIVLSSGARIFAASDDEFNDAGVLNYHYEGKTYTLTKRR